MLPPNHDPKLVPGFLMEDEKFSPHSNMGVELLGRAPGAITSATATAKSTSSGRDHTVLNLLWP